MYHLTYICPCFLGWKANIVFEETVIFRTEICDF